MIYSFMYRRKKSFKVFVVSVRLVVNWLLFAAIKLLFYSVESIFQFDMMALCGGMYGTLSLRGCRESYHCDVGGGVVVGRCHHFPATVI